MRAVWYDRFGPAAEVLTSGELPMPEPGPGEVLVRIHASGINPSDVKLRAGARPGATMAFPRVVPHSDGAGVIEAVGDGVDGARIGERVWLANAQWQDNRRHNHEDEEKHCQRQVGRRKNNVELFG